MTIKPKNTIKNDILDMFDQNKPDLNNLFIPSEQNNYYPTSLHPKRLAFYAISALIIKLIVIAIIILYPIGAWLTPDILNNESKKIVSLTNQIRLSNGLNTLTENSNLTMSANQKVQDMLIHQYFAHIGPDQAGLTKWLNDNQYQYNSAGENLAMGFMSAEDIVNAWIKSPTHYANLIDPGYKEIGVAMTSGYFKNIDTTLAAQHFGAPQANTFKPVTTPTVKKESNNKQQLNESSVTIIPAGSNITNTIASTADNKTVIDNKNMVQTTSTYEPIIVMPKNNEVLNTPDAMIIVFTPEKSSVTFNVNNQIQTPAIDTEGQYHRGQIILKEGKNVVRSIAKNSQGISIRSKEINLIVDSQTPIYNRPETFVKLSTPTGQKQTILEAQITSDEPLTTAEVTVGNYRMNLQKGATDQVWHGSLIIYDRYAKDFFNPVILPTAKFTDIAGNTTVTDIDWDKIQPIKTSFLDQYFFIKAQENSSADSIINFSNTYYKVMLVIFIIILQLNIFIKIKHQQPVAIVNAIAVIGLLIWLLLI